MKRSSSSASSDGVRLSARGIADVDDAIELSLVLFDGVSFSSRFTNWLKCSI